MAQRRVLIVTAAPGAVFLRTQGSLTELAPGEAVRLRIELDRAIRVAIATRDGTAILQALSGLPPPRRPPARPLEDA